MHRYLKVGHRHPARPRRNDGQARQAVSWALACPDGPLLHMRGRQARAVRRAGVRRPAPRWTPSLIREAEVGWHSFFESIGADPLELWFEDLAEHLEAQLGRILAWLGVPEGGRLRSRGSAIDRRGRSSI